MADLEQRLLAAARAVATAAPSAVPRLIVELRAVVAEYDRKARVRQVILDAPCTKCKKRYGDHEQKGREGYRHCADGQLAGVAVGTGEEVRRG